MSIVLTNIIIEFIIQHRRSLLQWCTYEEYVAARRQLKLRIDKALQKSVDDYGTAKEYKTEKLSMLTFLEDKITHPGVSNDAWGMLCNCGQSRSNPFSSNLENVTSECT